MGFAREPEGNLISSGYRLHYFLPTPPRKPDANAHKAATVANTLLFFMSLGWLRHREGKVLAKDLSAAAQAMKGTVKADMSLLDT